MSIDTHQRKKKKNMDVTDQTGSLESKPTVSFPVGLALLVIVLVSISTFFFCYLYWDRLRSLFFGPHPDSGSLQIATEKPLRSHSPVEKHIDEEARSVTVLMPGDEIPKFIAMACPRQPPIQGRISVLVEKLIF